MNFTRRGLEQVGFSGWIPFAALRSSTCPRAGGVYVITYPSQRSQRFEPTSCGGWFKGRNPSVSEEVLKANWVEGAEVVYCGKANQLHRRLVQFADFGTGKAMGHWGGRLIWHLPKPETLLVAWKETPGRDPLSVEAELIGAFRARFGKPPFANEPHRMGC